MSNEEIGGRSAAVSVQPMPPARLIVSRSTSIGDGEIPENVSQLWERLDLPDGPMVLFLEAIVRSVRLDGSAPIAEVITRYATAQSNAELRPDRITSSDDGAGDLGDVRREFLQSVLPSLASAEMIILPAEGLESPTASITISNPWLRLALLEAGLIQLDPAIEGANALTARGSGYVPTAPRAPSVPQTDRAARAECAPHDDWAQLWFAVQRYDWCTLAVVSASPGANVVEAAQALVSAGRMYNDGGVELIDATNATPATVDRIIASMSGAVARDARLVVALDSPLANPASIPIARHANIALLAVRLGTATLESTRRALGVIGRDSFVGSVALR
ncbi:MAG: hypothetical protein ABI120_10920 [Gemmatimonadaceae bacterium]